MVKAIALRLIFTTTMSKQLAESLAASFSSISLGE